VYSHRSSQEVEEDVSESLEIVPPRLLSTQMGVDRHVPSRSTETLSLTIRDVLCFESTPGHEGDQLLGCRQLLEGSRLTLRLGISVLLGHSEIDDVNGVGSLRSRSTDEEVVRLDVSVDEVLLVDGLDSGELRGRGEEREIGNERDGRSALVPLPPFLHRSPALPLSPDPSRSSSNGQYEEKHIESRLTICLAVMTTVLMLNFRPHMSKRSSNEGPRRSITRMLCSPSFPK